MNRIGFTLSVHYLVSRARLFYCFNWMVSNSTSFHNPHRSSEDEGKKLRARYFTPSGNLAFCMTLTYCNFGLSIKQQTSESKPFGKLSNHSASRCFALKKHNPGFKDLLHQIKQFTTTAALPTFVHASLAERKTAKTMRLFTYWLYWNLSTHKWGCVYQINVWLFQYHHQTTIQ